MGCCGASAKGINEPNKIEPSAKSTSDKTPLVPHKVEPAGMFCSLEVYKFRKNVKIQIIRDTSKGTSKVVQDSTPLLMDDVEIIHLGTEATKGASPKDKKSSSSPKDKKSKSPRDDDGGKDKTSKSKKPDQQSEPAVTSRTAAGKGVPEVLQKPANPRPKPPKLPAIEPLPARPQLSAAEREANRYAHVLEKYPDYEFIKKEGDGSFGEVILVRDTRTKQELTLYV